MLFPFLLDYMLMQARIPLHLTTTACPFFIKEATSIKVLAYDNTMMMGQKIKLSTLCIYSISETIISAGEGRVTRQDAPSF